MLSMHISWDRVRGRFQAEREVGRGQWAVGKWRGGIRDRGGPTTSLGENTFHSDKIEIVGFLCIIHFPFFFICRRMRCEDVFLGWIRVALRLMC